jgi:hypothetical protein
MAEDHGRLVLYICSRGWQVDSLLESRAELVVYGYHVGKVMLLLTDFLPVANLPFLAFIAMEATSSFETLLPFVLSSGVIGVLR